MGLGHSSKSQPRIQRCTISHTRIMRLCISMVTENWALKCRLQLGDLKVLSSRKMFAADFGNLLRGARLVILLVSGYRDGDMEDRINEYTNRVCLWQLLWFKPPMECSCPTQLPWPGITTLEHDKPTSYPANGNPSAANAKSDEALTQRRLLPVPPSDKRPCAWETRTSCGGTMRRHWTTSSSSTAE